MIPTLKETVKRLLVVYLTAALFVLAAVPPSDVHAMFLPSGVSLAEKDSSVHRKQDTDKLQKILESRLVSQRLADLGFSQKDISSRLDRLSDEQVHYFASHLESVQTGGDAGLGIIIALLVIAILVVVLLQLTGHKILITK